MAKRTIYVRDEDEALFDRLSGQGNLSAIIARAVKAECGDARPAAMRQDLELEQLHSRGQLIEFAVETDESKRRPEPLSSLMQVDPLCIEVGAGLLHLVDPAKGAHLLERIPPMRRRIAMDLGLVMSGVRFRDNRLLQPGEYSIRLRDVEMVRVLVPGDSLLAVSPTGKLPRFKGVRGVEPASGSPALWIEPDLRAEAEQQGLLVRDQAAVVSDHIGQLVRSHAHEMLGVQETEALLGPLRKTHPTLLDVAFPGRVTLLQFWELLRRLLRECVSIRDLVGILEAVLLLGSWHLERAVEACRLAMARNICHAYTDNRGILRCIELSPMLEEQLTQTEASLQGIRREADTLRVQGIVPVLVCASEIRASLSERLRSDQGFIAVLSREEVRGAKAEVLATVATA